MSYLLRIIDVVGVSYRGKEDERFFDVEQTFTFSFPYIFSYAKGKNCHYIKASSKQVKEKRFQKIEGTEVNFGKYSYK